MWLGSRTIPASAFKQKQFKTKTWRNSTCSHACGWIQACFILHFCTKGFYKPDKDGAFACKAQALFIKKHGKEKFLQVHDNLHKNYDFKKTQEILGKSVEEGLKILKKNM